MAVQATFQSMGLQSEKAAATHLLENAHESNLLSDISRVDYLASSWSRTHLCPLPGLPTFIDDVYVYSYLCQEDCVVHRRRLSCTTRDNSSTKNIVTWISIAVHESIGASRSYIQTSIVHILAV
ncbi:MAG: hypothetical protein AB2556_16090 [Candidatus Thiodiazotropha sp.]